MKYSWLSLSACGSYIEQVWCQILIDSNCLIIGNMFPWEICHRLTGAWHWQSCHDTFVTMSCLDKYTYSRRFININTLEKYRLTRRAILSSIIWFMSWHLCDYVTHFLSINVVTNQSCTNSTEEDFCGHCFEARSNLPNLVSMRTSRSTSPKGPKPFTQSNR